MGGLFDGWALYLLESKPVFHYNFGNMSRYDIAGKDALSPGKHTIFFDFAYDGGGIGRGGTGTISLDGKEVAQGRIEKTVPVPFTMSVETFDIGEDTGTPVNLSYEVPFRFTGMINHVTIALKPQDQASADETTAATHRADVAKLERQ